MKLSFILPVYNVEDYLPECLDSLLNQKECASDYEIILIENNSTDNSPQIAKKYTKEYSKIKLFYCKTPGASAARNFGVKKAKGDFIWFIDSDDFISKKSLSAVLEIVNSENPDLISFDTERFNEKGHKDILTHIDPKKPDWKNRFVRYGLGPWSLIIRRQWFLKNNLFFHEGIIHEDMAIMSSYILYTNKLSSIKKTLCHYRQHDNSVLHQKTWNKNRFDIFPALTDLYNSFKKSSNFETYKEDLEWFIIWNLLVDSAKDFSKSKEGHSGFARSRNFLKTYFPKWQKNKHLQKMPPGIKLRVFFNFHHL